MDKYNLTAADRSRILRALRNAYRTGCDPYNSHNTQAAKYARALADAHRRAADKAARSEYAANAAMQVAA